MLVNYYFPFSLSAQRLDKYLASGWFRNCNMLFKAKVLCLDGELHNIINIRLDLTKQEEFSKKLLKIQECGHKKFKIKVVKARFTADHEALYRAHQKRFKGYIYKNLQQFLYGEVNAKYNIYNTQSIEVYDDKKLIAFSFFDLGEQSMASILGVFDDTYSKYSLGFFTMIEEIRFAKMQGFRYYYPGYVLDQSDAFSYKLKMGKYDFYDEGKWKPIEKINYEKLSRSQIIDKLKSCEKYLIEQNIRHTWKFYPYFSLGYFQDVGHPFVKSPIHLVLDERQEEGEYKIIEYDIDTDNINTIDVLECPEYDFILKEQDKMNLNNSANQWGKVLRYK